MFHAGREWLNVTALAERVGVSKRTIQNWRMAGKLDTMYLVSGRHVIAVDSVFKDAAPRTVVEILMQQGVVK